MYCSLTVQVGNNIPGLMVFELFSYDLPKTCENFKALCTGDFSKPSFSIL